MNVLHVENCPKCHETLEEYHGYYYCKTHGHFESWKCESCKAPVYGFKLSDGHAFLCPNCLKEHRQIQFDKRLAKAKALVERRFENDVIDNPERAFQEFKTQKAREKLRKLGYRI